MRDLSKTWIILEAKDSDLPGDIQGKIATAAEWLPISRVLLLTNKATLPYLEEERTMLPPENLWVQPEGWGNAPLLAWCFRHLEKIDAAAEVLFIPSRGGLPPLPELDTLIDRRINGDASTQILILNLPGHHIPESALLGSVSTLLLLLMTSYPALVLPWIDGGTAKKGWTLRDSERDLLRDVLLGNPLFLEEWTIVPEHDAAVGIVGFSRPRTENRALPRDLSVH